MITQNYSFVKYQSLGNDFILILTNDLFPSFDRSLLTTHAWQAWVKKQCDRHFGIGADGILLFLNSPEAPEVFIINADGTLGQFSGNGSRCAAHFYAKRYAISTPFTLLMGEKQLECHVNLETNEVITELLPGMYEGVHTASVRERVFEGDLVDVGNPHFLISYPQAADQTVEQVRTSIKKMLTLVGYDLVVHQGLDQQKNIQIYFSTNDLTYHVVPYERGAGMTLACSSGAAALAWMLFYKKILLPSTQLAVVMEGGLVMVTISADQKIMLRAEATLLFYGVCEN